MEALLKRAKVNEPKLVFIGWVAVTVVLLFIANSTTPDRVGPQGITIIFVLLYFFFSLSLILITHLSMKLLQRNRVFSHWKTSHGFVFGFIPTMGLALQSLDQLVFRDILIFGGIAGLVAFYIMKRPVKG